MEYSGTTIRANRYEGQGSNSVLLRLNILPSLNHKLPEGIKVSQLEQAINDAFSQRNLKLVGDFFHYESNSYPHNLSHIVCAMEAGMSIPIAGGVIIETETLNAPQKGEFKFLYLNKVFVTNPYRSNGLGYNMISEVIDFSDLNLGGLPLVLRTSSEELHKKIYSKGSDINEKKGVYYVHGYGFLNEKKEPLFKNAEYWFEQALNHVVSKAPTLVPIKPQNR